jgi:hypothetical protein
MKINRLFFLGAGFSTEAGIPLTAELLTKAMKKFEEECPGIFWRVNNYARECTLTPEDEDVDYSKVDFSELCTFLEFIELREYGGGERWKASGSKEKLNLRYYLAKAIIEAMPLPGNVPSIYKDFVSELHKGDIVITFNWDPLLEVALESVGKKYCYNYDNPDEIKLFKLHGSVNWRLGELHEYETSPVDLCWESLKFSEGILDTEMYFSEKLIEHEILNSSVRNSQVEPFLVLPGYGKAFDVRSNSVLWYKPEFIFGFTHDVYIIGLSVAPDDFFIRSFFLSNLPHLASDARHIHIINPAVDANINYDFVLNSGDATLHNERFEIKHVELMRASRSPTSPSSRAQKNCAGV